MTATTRVFDKEVLAKKLHDELNAIIEPVFEGIQTFKPVSGQATVTVVLSQEPTTQQDADILQVINDHDPTPLEITIEEDATKKRQADGEKLYQKMYADLSLNGTFATVDSSIIGYDTLTKLRCMLKDGSGKTALRYIFTDPVINHAETPLFPADQHERFRVLIRDYCFNHREGDGVDHNSIPYVNYDRASYDLFLDYIEQAPSV